MRVCHVLRGLTSVVAILALLMASDPALAEIIFTPPEVCHCNMLFCPMRHAAHRTANTQAKDRGMDSQSTSNRCSVSNCYQMQARAAVDAALVRVAPPAVPVEKLAQPAPVSVPMLFTSVFRTPPSPPPRSALI